ncbi:MAG: hypothetical protein WA843_01825, partial [Candidatus Saccharimonadales bacterium]
DGTKPHVALTEFGYWTATRGENNDTTFSESIRQRYVSDRRRAIYYWEALNIACDDPNVVLLLFYGVTPPSPGWPAPWNTATVTAQYKPMVSYRSIQRFAKTHPECIKSDLTSGATAATSTRGTASRATNSSGQAERR